MISNDERKRIRKVIRRNHGAAIRLARILASQTGGKVSTYQSAISRWLRGQTTSARIDEAAARFVDELEKK